MIYEIETACLKLRRPTSDDILVLRNLWRDRRVRRFLGGVIPDEMIDKKIVAIQDHWSKYNFGQCSVIKKYNHQLTGICGLNTSEEGIELCYMFFPKFWGQGIAKEATLASIYFGFNTLKLDKIVAITQEANHKSCKLLENIGMDHIKNFSRFNANQRWYEVRKAK